MKRAALAIAAALFAAPVAAGPLDWRMFLRDLGFGDGSGILLQFAIVDLPGDMQFRVTYSQRLRGTPRFAVLNPASPRQSASVAFRLTENGKQSLIQPQKLVYRQLEGVRGDIPEGLLDRMRAAEGIAFKLDTSMIWYITDADSFREVVPQLTCVE
ncbi:MAG: hypothetical protein AAF618_03875 [Pseudomonadota bacterium]